MATRPGIAPPARPFSRRWFWGVCTAALVVPLICWSLILLLFVFGSRDDPCAEWQRPADLFPYVFGGVVLTLPYLHILVRLTLGLLRNRADKRGLALAVIMGSAGLVISALVTSAKLVAFVFGLSHGLLAVTAIETYYSTEREPGDYAKLAKGFIPFAVYGGVLFISFVIVPNFMHTKMGPAVAISPSAGALSSLRTINTAEATYNHTYGDSYSNSLPALGPGTGNWGPTPSAAGLIDAALASGKKYIYAITYKPGPPDAQGKIKTYTVTARPVGSCRAKGFPSFFTDPSGVIRMTQENRDATAADSPVGG